MEHTQSPYRGYHILTYGCQMNTRDSEIICGLLENAGYTEVPLEEADLVVFNTCSVRHSAENKVYGKLGEVNKIKRSKPGLKIAFGGCMAQLPEAVKRLKRHGVDLVFGTHNLHQLPVLLERINSGEKQIIEVWDQHGGIIEDLPSTRKEGVSAFVNIMYGCNNFCSYCIVPYTRGRERSRNARDIIRELEELAAAGFKDVTLLGQNVNSYGRGANQIMDFAGLLKMADKVDGLERIRFMTSHPKDMSDDLIDTIAGGEKLCEHIHVPLQAGSNRVLKRMNRGYTREHYLQLVNKMRERIPGVAITSDLIVGFPGESDADFEDTLDMVEQVRFDAAFTFMYSVRTGTRAASLSDQIELAVKQDRLMRLNQKQYDIALQINRALEGQTLEILVDGPSKTNPDRLTGRTRTNHIVIFSGTNDLIGQRINVKITTSKTFSIFAEISA